MKQFVLDPKIMKNWPWELWVIFLGLVGLVIDFLYVLVSIYAGSEVIKIYLSWSALVFAFYSFKTYNCKDFHLHHYALTMTLVSFICY